MSIEERIGIYHAIEKHRRRPMVVYVTSTRPNLVAQMAGDAVRELIDQIDAIDPTETSIDILIHSTGGDPLTAWKLMSVLRERFDDVAVLVPSTAFSAATLFALGADEIVMHPHASLGPIDPQITVRKPDGSATTFSYEEIGAFLRFMRDDVGITEQSHLTEVAARMLRTVAPLTIGAAKRASELASEVGERLLRMHMTDPLDEQQARDIAENLNRSFFDHGDAVSRRRARELSLNIAESDPEIDALLWRAFEAIEAYMDLRVAFDPLREFLADAAGAAAVAPLAPLNLPPNAPPQIVEQTWRAAARAALEGTSQARVEVPFKTTHAILESTRMASAYVAEGSLSAVRALGGEIEIAAVRKDAGWRPVAVPNDVTANAQE